MKTQAWGTAAQLLGERTADVRRLALMGLAKNTGKTTALLSLLAAGDHAGRCLGVTSIGRDGEPQDVIDIRIQKPRLRLPRGSLLASTDTLLNASEIPYELLEATGMRTPLGEVQIAALRECGTIEVAGPSAARDIRAVSDAMLAHGAEQILIDGAIDRRAAASPAVSDGVVMATGAVLAADVEQVTQQTRDAAGLMGLPAVTDPLVRTLAERIHESVLLDAAGNTVPLPSRFLLSATTQQVAQLLRSNPAMSRLIVRGALCESFLEGLLKAGRGELPRLTVADSTKVFLTNHGCDWYMRHGLTVDVLRRSELKAITINPVAPQAHSFDSEDFQLRIEDAVPEVPVFDLMRVETRTGPTRLSCAL